jgi:microcystin-dependent protein
MGSLSRGTKADQFSYVPAGTVLPFAGDTAPSGWAICNGDPVSRTDYAELFTAIGELWGVGDGSTTFNLPDMRGQFLRGLDTTEGVDPDFATRIVGSSQVDEFKNHRHNFTQSFDDFGDPGGSIIVDNQNGGTNTTNIFESGGAETRPKNVAVNYIIKL